MTDKAHMSRMNNEQAWQKLLPKAASIHPFQATIYIMARVRLCCRCSHQGMGHCNQNEASCVKVPRARVKHGMPVVSRALLEARPRHSASCA